MNNINQISSFFFVLYLFYLSKCLFTALNNTKQKQFQIFLIFNLLLINPVNLCCTYYAESVFSLPRNRPYTISLTNPSTLPTLHTSQLTSKLIQTLYLQGITNKIIKTITFQKVSWMWIQIFAVSPSNQSNPSYNPLDYLSRILRLQTTLIFSKSEKEPFAFFSMEAILAYLDTPHLKRRSKIFLKLTTFKCFTTLSCLSNET